MTAENELSPAMKIFAWRGPSRSDVTDIEPEATTPSPAGFVPIITETVTPAAPDTSNIEISLGGAVLRVASNINRALLTEVLSAIRSSAPAATAT
jgi:hypothetical protein